MRPGTLILNSPGIFALLIVFIVTVYWTLTLSQQSFNSLHISFPATSSESISSALSISDVRLQLESELSAPEVQTAYTSFLRTVPGFSAHSVRIYKLTYKIAKDQDAPIDASALVFAPQGIAQSIPVLVYGPGTTGLADRCAPSEENPLRPSLGNYRNQMVSHAAQGTIVVMPDYLGFDTTEQLNYYFIAREEAYGMLGSARAFFEATEKTNINSRFQKGTIFVGGYSQGGHAAFATADHVKELTPDIQIRGVIGHGATTNTIDLLDSSPNLAPYLVNAYENYYDDFLAENIIDQNWLSEVGEAERVCADEGFGYNTVRKESVFTPQFLRLINGQDYTSVEIAAEKSRLEENNAGVHFSNTPVFIAQGTTDPIVTKEDQDVLVESLCSRSVPVEYQLYDGVHHFDIRQVSFWDTHVWMKQIQNNQKTSTC